MHIVMLSFQPFLAHHRRTLAISYTIIEICILDYPAVSDLSSNNIQSFKGRISPQGCSEGGGGV
jgi:hypothetical protein